MGYARKQLVSLQDTPYYHCVARCVRRAWLWGVDEYAGKDYSHRKQWVIDRLRLLCSVFAIEVCAYAIMSNHYHLVLYVDHERARRWTKKEVVERWTVLFRLPILVKRWLSGEAVDAEVAAAEAIIETWRARLYDISWFMRCLNEYLARRANQEDQCTGRFWEGRFKSQALLDEAGLLTAMAYVDLNPIRAGIAKSPAEAEFTSIYERIKELNVNKSRGRPTRTMVPLRPFKEVGRASSSTIPYSLRDYVLLLEWSGRLISSAQRKDSALAAPAILASVGIECESWRRLISRSGSIFGRAMGRLNAMRLHASTLRQSWIRGVRSAALIYAT